MTPEHWFQLFLTCILAIPATVLSAWALIDQHRQTATRLKVLVSPVFWEGVHGEEWLADDLPGIVVLNKSTFPLRVSSIGFRIGRKFYAFGRPVAGRDLQPASEWPMEIAPRSRIGFYLNPHTIDALTFTNYVTPVLNGRPIWEVGRAYAMTECSHTFVSPRLSKRNIEMLSKAHKIKLGEDMRKAAASQSSA